MMRISELVLVSRDHRLRSLILDRPFTFIIGPNDSGKTAIIRIVEYVLGRNTCDIPKGVIRRKVAWYALKLKVKERALWVARRSPGADIGESDDYYILEGDSLGDLDPRAITANSTTDGVMRHLSALLGIPSNKLLPRRGSSLSLGEANIRHALPLCFQPQDVIASSSMLFYRQNEEWMSRDLRAALPYFLGIVDDEQLQAQQHARALVRQINQAESEIKGLQDAARGASEKGAAIVARATRVGMFSNPVPDALKEALSMIAMWSPRKAGTSGPAAPIESVRAKLANLHEKEASLQARLAEIDDFLAPQTLRAEHLEQANVRLKSIGLLDSVSGGHCPMCGGESHASKQKEILQGIQGRVKVSMQQVSSSKRGLTEAKARIAEELNNLQSDLRKAYADVEADAKLQGDLAESRTIDIQRGQVMAEARQWLQNAEQENQIAAMKARVERLGQLHEQFATKLGRLEDVEGEAAILVRIAGYATRLAGRLDLPDNDGTIRLDLENMTIVADTVRDGSVPLSQMGGAVNWEAYHVAMHYAIHREMQAHGRPVPSFLILDQPSQVGAASKGKQGAESRLANLYKLFQATAQEIGPNFQVIVTEHESIQHLGIAPEPHYSFTTEARLVPSDWPEGLPGQGGNSS